MTLLLGLLWLLASPQRAPIVPVGSVAPAFTVNDDRGSARSLADFKGKWIVLEWHEKGCPYVTKHLEGARNYVQQALTEARAGRPVTPASTEPSGCSIHYSATQGR